MDERTFKTAERIAVLEEKMTKLEKELKTIDDKLDELLQLRSRGVGAFWLASGLLGTGIIGLIVTMINWLKS